METKKKRITRADIANRLETLAQMIRDGDETTIEINEAQAAINAIQRCEPFQEPR